MEDEAAPPSSLVRAGLIDGEARVHYTDMPREEEAKFRQALVDKAYNLRLLEEHHEAEELLVASTSIMLYMEVPE